jgi:multiple sugar transport system permease protein
LIVPAYLGNAFYIFLIRQFFCRSQRLEMRLVWRTNFLHLVANFPAKLAPVLLTVMLFSFVGSWNDFFGPLLYLGKLEQ